MPARSVIVTLALAGPLAALAGCVSDGGGDTTIFADILPNFSPPTPSEAARDAFNVYDADKRRHAVNLLAQATFGGEEPYLRTYRLLLDDPDPSVRAACVRALGQHGTVEDVNLLTPSLADASAFVRWEAAKALQRIHHPAAIDPLRRTLAGDEDTDVRQACAVALGQYPTRPVFDTLVSALIDANFGVALAARQSLQTLTGADLGGEPAEWLQWADAHRAALFANQRPYAYYPYDKPPGTFEKMMPWHKDEPVTPRTPTGLGAVESATDAG